METTAEKISLSNIQEKYYTPLLELVQEASEVHKKFHPKNKVQISRLVSIKTGGCPEDCAYCPQAARYQTDINVHKLMSLEEVVDKAKHAKATGASRLCMGASWREVRDNSDFDRVIDMVKAVNDLDLEVCCTLGMLNANQAKKLAEAGLHAYNHNLDTSEEFYGDIISTREYDDRLNTIENVRKANLTVCSGGILGLGETHEDRIQMLHTLSNLTPAPESVPINTLVAVEGTPLENQEKVPFDDVVRMVATARIVMPRSVIRLSAGRDQMSISEQALCFLAGANSFFSGDKLLTTPNPNETQDKNMMDTLGLEPKRPFEKHQKDG